MLKIETPQDKNKIQEQIKMLEWQLTQDTNDKDKEIHKQALEDLKRALN